MKTYRIENTITGVNLGEYTTDDEAKALDAMARDCGYADHASACVTAKLAPGELLVTDISPSPAP